MGNLVLTRHRGQKIQIGPDITATVVSVRGGSVRLAIAAPPATKILRGELVNREKPPTFNPPAPHGNG